MLNHEAITKVECSVCGQPSIAIVRVNMRIMGMCDNCLRSCQHVAVVFARANMELRDCCREVDSGIVGTHVKKLAAELNVEEWGYTRENAAIRAARERVKELAVKVVAT